MNRVRLSATVAAALATAVAALGTPAGAQTLPSGKVSAFSGTAFIDKGQVVGNASIALPACPSGELFLVQALTAAPDPRTLLSATSLTATWGIIVSTTQHTTTRGLLLLPLTAYGHGVEHAEVDLPGGQPVYSSTIYYTVMLVGAAASSPIRFNVHFSGACGKQTVAP
jgi:hypothetical protein